MQTTSNIDIRPGTGPDPLVDVNGGACRIGVLGEPPGVPSEAVVEVPVLVDEPDDGERLKQLLGNLSPEPVVDTPILVLAGSPA
jgi:hypothetical protein